MTTFNVELLRRARKDAGLSLTQLAAAADLSYPMLNRFETRHGVPTLPALERLAQALDCDLLDFFERDDEPVSAS